MEAQLNTSTNANKDYDVVIVGAGLVGASLGLALKPLGLKIAIIESYTPSVSDLTPSYNDRSIALSHGSSLIFQGMNFWEKFKSYASEIASIHVSDKGYFGAARLKAEQENLPALGYLMESKRMGSLLLDALNQSKDSLDLITPATVMAIDENISNDAVQGSVTLEVQRSDTNEAIKINSKLLIGADGTNSNVRKLTGIEVETVDYQQSAIITNVSSQNPHKQQAFERFTRSGPIALLPMNDERLDDQKALNSNSHRSALVWTHKPESVSAISELNDDDFLRALNKDFGHRLGQFTRVGERSVFPLSITLAKEHVDISSRAIIIGNASHTLHPVAGQGLNLALRDVAVLSDLIASTDVLGSREMLEQYEKMRLDDINSTSNYTHTLVTAFSNDLPILGHMRASGIMAIDRIKPMRDWFVGRSMGLNYRQSRLARGLPIVDERHKNQGPVV